MDKEIRTKGLRMLIVCALACVSFIAQAQKSESLKDFDYLVEKVKNDYPGYKNKVNNETGAVLKQLEQELRNRMIQYPDSCGKYLSLYTSWFKDNHLRVKRNRSSLNTGTSKRPATPPNFYPIVLDSIANSTQSIAGVWIGFRGENGSCKEKRWKFCRSGHPISQFQKQPGNV